MTARTEDAPARDTERRRSASDLKILRAAKELFLADRYAGVSLERVAERAGVSRQTVYNRFGSKEAVFREMVRHHWAAFAAFAEQDGRSAADDGGDGDASAEEVLRAFARSLRRFAEETDQILFARLVVAESARLPWIADEFHRLGKGPVVAAFTGRLDALVRAGRLRCPDTRLAARQFMGLVQEFLVWPRVMGFTEEIAAGPGPDVVIDEAVATFLARYAAPGEVGSA
ncbi:TetR/AcrR family transcriptional regulator [Streptomyces thermocarboxydus]|uniref:TetR/AcrR family transcriptional regulator n=1 Tax=Streptomyces TaxID=1883 RepID=UPI001676C7C0|nr:TetR/AcrR family transcriptional regulator [Streptomyces sp. AC04842]MDN3287579.1 TetR/AcrR family transcriptional regulator [Streptomyces thermocarboxydus]GHE30265.1 transcriptional regulator [Streptomyces cellulosae]